MRKSITLILAVLATLSAQASITLNFEGGLLFGANTSSPLVDGRLVFAVTTSNQSFSGPIEGSFVTGGDTLLGSWTTSSVTAGQGSFSAALTALPYGGSISAGQRVAIYWFTDLSSMEFGPAAGASYGFYSDPTWLIPADGSGVSYSLETAAIEGPTPNSATVANLTVAAVPEPTTYATLFGAAAIGFCFLRRRRA